VIIVALIALWDWDWFIPLVDAQASSTLHRKVTIGHLHVALGRTIHVTADDVTVANPTDWPADAPPFVHLGALNLAVDVWPFVRYQDLVITSIGLDHPDVTLLQQASGASNYDLQLSGGSGGGGTTKIGDLQIAGGQVVAKLVKLRTDMTVDVATRQQGDQSQIVASAHGTYGGAPITGEAVGGALLSLRDATSPWPIDLHVANGPTKVALAGTLEDPLHLKGANLKLQFSGPDMNALEALTGIPIPKTPPYRITGNLDFANGAIQFKDFAGVVGNSDLEGTFNYTPKQPRPVLDADLRSRRVDLADLGGFIGASPGRVSTAGKTPAQRAETARAEASPHLLPNTPINVPRLTWADIHLKYNGERIEGRSVPFNHLEAVLDIDDGAILLHPLSFGVGTGQIRGNIALTPENDRTLKAKADIDVNRIDVSSLMAATHTFHGAGTISGTANIDTRGNSLATMLGNGDGGVRLGMAGGDLSALMVDLSGLEFGKAVLSALGIPDQTKVECLVDDMPLHRGVITVKAFVLDTGEAIINGAGTINLRDEGLDLALKTESTHFSIGSLPTPINITGTFKDPTIRPGAELLVRGGLVAGLAAVFPPLAILPTIQFGVGDDHRCDRLLHEARAEPGGSRLPAAKEQPARR
jgi:uncharacterized protein involved in outer membrane biogenesis